MGTSDSSELKSPQMADERTRVGVEKLVHEHTRFHCLADAFHRGDEVPSAIAEASAIRPAEGGWRTWPGISSESSI